MAPFLRALSDNKMAGVEGMKEEVGSERSKNEGKKSRDTETVGGETGPNQWVYNNMSNTSVHVVQHGGKKQCLLWKKIINIPQPEK